MNIKAVAPVILTIAGCVATVGAVVLSAMETPDAVKFLDDHRLEIDPSGESDLCVQEKVVDYAKSYKKTIACTTLALACSVGACILGSKNYKLLLKSSAATAALSTAYSSKYASKVRKLIGDEKARLLDKEVMEEIKYETDHYTDTATFVYTFPEDESGVPMYEPIKIKSSLQMMNELKEDLLYAIADGEVRSVGETFPQLCRAIDKKDPRQYQLDRMWHQDILLEDYGTMLPKIIFEPINFKGSEYKDCRQDDKINNGQPAYLIRCLEMPEPPECIMTEDC